MRQNINVTKLILVFWIFTAKHTLRRLCHLYFPEVVRHILNWISRQLMSSIILQNRQDFFLSAFAPHTSHCSDLQFHTQQSPEHAICILASCRKAFLVFMSAQSSFNYVQSQKCHFIYQKATFQCWNVFVPSTLSSLIIRVCTIHLGVGLRQSHMTSVLLTGLLYVFRVVPRLWLTEKFCTLQEKKTKVLTSGVLWILLPSTRGLGISADINAAERYSREEVASAPELLHFINFPGW